MKHRNLSLLSLLLATILLFAACGKKQEPASGAAAATPSGIGAAGEASGTPTTDSNLSSAPGTPTPIGLTTQPTQGAAATPDIDSVTPTITLSDPTIIPSGAATPSPDTKQPEPSSAANPGTATPILTTAAGKTPTKAAGNTSTPTLTPKKSSGNTSTPSPTPSKKPGNTSTPSPTPTPEPVVWDEPWEDAVCRDDIAAALMQKVNAYRVNKGIPAYEDPYDCRASVADYLFNAAHRVAREQVLLRDARHENNQIGTGVVWYTTGKDADFIDTIAETAFSHWYNSKAHNANMLDDSSPYYIDVAVMAVYEWYDGMFYYYTCIMGSSTTSVRN
ncbi:MAG: hypothetical protein Q4C48_03345 [Lachnospiraceae bacterium]|nr:hypothetical protein [Lachnospiraceae bacterium]